MAEYFTDIGAKVQLIQELFNILIDNRSNSNFSFCNSWYIMFLWVKYFLNSQNMWSIVSGSAPHSQFGLLTAATLYRWLLLNVDKNFNLHSKKIYFFSRHIKIFLPFFYFIFYQILLHPCHYLLNRMFGQGVWYFITDYIRLTFYPYQLYGPILFLLF